MKIKKESLVRVLQSIGQKLKDLRIGLGYDSSREFAESNDLPPVHYWKVENGKTNITMKTLTKLLSIHNIGVEEFFCAG